MLLVLSPACIVVPARRCSAVPCMRLVMQVHSCCSCGVHDCLQVKLPITLEGAKAARRLISDGVPVTMTGECISKAEE